MRIAVVGAGGIGCIYGASLANAGVDGLKIEGDRGEIAVIRPTPVIPCYASENSLLRVRREFASKPLL